MQTFFLAATLALLAVSVIVASQPAAADFKCHSPPSPHCTQR
jgi:hypothetical protein